MKGTYRVYVKGVLHPDDWELVGSAPDADEAWAMSKHWEETIGVTAVRVDLCVKFLEPTSTDNPS